MRDGKLNWGDCDRSGARPIDPVAMTVAQAARLLGASEQTIRVTKWRPGCGPALNLLRYAA